MVVETPKYFCADLTAANPISGSHGFPSQKGPEQPQAWKHFSLKSLDPGLQQETIAHTQREGPFLEESVSLDVVVEGRVRSPKSFALITFEMVSSDQIRRFEKPLAKSRKKSLALALDADVWGRHRPEIILSSASGSTTRIRTRTGNIAGLQITREATPKRNHPWSNCILVKSGVGLGDDV